MKQSHEKTVADASEVLEHLATKYNPKEAHKALRTLLVATDMLTAHLGLGDMLHTVPSGKDKINELYFRSTQYTMN